MPEAMEVGSSGRCRCIADGYAQPDSIPFPRPHMTASRDVPRRHMPLLDSTPRIDYCLLLLVLHHQPPPGIYRYLHSHKEKPLTG